MWTLVSQALHGRGVAVAKEDERALEHGGCDQAVIRDAGCEHDRKPEVEPRIWVGFSELCGCRIRRWLGGLVHCYARRRTRLTWQHVSGGHREATHRAAAPREGQSHGHRMLPRGCMLFRDDETG